MREKHELVSWYKADTVLIFCIRHVHLLMLGYSARLVLREKGGSIERHKSILAMIPINYFPVEVPGFGSNRYC